MVAAGMAITKLNEIAAARSLRPTLMICAEKDFQTLYSGCPSQPGNTIFLLMRRVNATGGELNMMRSSFVNLINWFWYGVLYRCLQTVKLRF